VRKEQSRVGQVQAAPGFELAANKIQAQQTTGLDGKPEMPHNRSSLLLTNTTLRSPGRQVTDSVSLIW
jgi:hypothetical protein